MNYKPVNIIAFILILLLLSGCSAQKNTGLSRGYHNLTAKYNVLFNGTESFKDGLEKIDKEFKDDYSDILPVFNYKRKEIISIASADMDRTIKKCSKLITLHSITAKPKVRDDKTLSPEERAFFSKKEYNMFVDDAYLLMGKSHFYKHEYALAGDVFRKIISDFRNQPAVYESQVWLARLYIETGLLMDASEILATLNNNASFPEKLLKDLFPTNADYHISRKEYADAIGFLEKAVELEKRKKPLTRYNFILAQLYEKTGDLKKASESYEKVVKMNPAYEMAFNAHINRALAYEQGFGQAGEIENELIRMLHDDKNLEYQDQIYFALGNLATKEGDEKKALGYYVKSIETNKGNDQQKIRSYLTLANHYYAIPDYPNAQSYYDSAVSKIDPDYPGYNALYTKSKSLTRLVTEINTVNLGDSVLKLAGMPSEELNKKIADIITAERKKQEEIRLKQQDQQLNEQFGQEVAAKNTSRTATNESATQWYFYNDAAKSLGYSEFKLKWGNRRLEDHWQRASKAMVNFGTDEELSDSEGGNSEAATAEDNLSRDFYLSGIPFTDSAASETRKRIEMSLYNMGVIYKDDLKDFDKANESFRELIKRYPASEYLLSTYYNLYGIAREQNNQAMVEYYKNLITVQFPESMYAKVLNDPEYFRELEKEDKTIRDYYEQTYKLYQGGNYSEVVARSGTALREHPSHVLSPQFDYLGILAYGKTNDRKIFRDSLIAVATKYPGTEIEADARNLIAYMDQEHPEIKEAEEVKISQQMYMFSPPAKHLFMLALDKKINTNQLVFNIINYNLDHSDSLNLIVEIMNLDARYNLISVKHFRNMEIASRYLTDIVVSEEIRKDMPEFILTPFIISERNLNTLREDKSVDRYLKFYNENYR